MSQLSARGNQPVLGWADAGGALKFLSSAYTPAAPCHDVRNKMRAYNIDVLVITVISPEVDAALGALHIAKHSRHKLPDTGTVFFTGAFHSDIARRDLSIAVGVLGWPGNTNAALSTLELLTHLRPRRAILMGIAAGVRSKTKIGGVVLGDRIVAYEPASLEVQDEQSVRVDRPDIERVPQTVKQDLVLYKPDESYIQNVFKASGGRLPAPRKAQTAKDEFKMHVARRLVVDTSTIASGEKLLKDPSKIIAYRKLHGKIVSLEMEGTGFAEACVRKGVPWLVIRGISDFGDELKDDRFHAFASLRAAAVLADFLRSGLDVSDTDPPPGGAELADDGGNASGRGERLEPDPPTAPLPEPMAAAPPCRQRPYQLPSDDPRFVGHADVLAALEAKLRPHPQLTPVAGISGEGGIGKTCTSIHLAHRVLNFFPDGNLFVEVGATLGGPSLSVDDVMRFVVSSLAPDKPLPQSPAEIVGEYRTILAGRRVVLVLDDVPDAAFVESLLPPPGSAVIASSREALIVHGDAFVRIPELDSESAVTLFCSIAGKEASDYAATICSLCGNLPLAVRAAASHLAVSIDVDPTAYARSLRDRRTRLERIGRTGVARDVQACFELSYEKLGPRQARIFRKLSVFSSSFDADAEASICSDEGNEFLRRLVRLSLVQYNRTTRRYRLHDLVRLFAADKLDGRGQEKEDVEARWAAYYSGRISELRRSYDAGGIEAMTTAVVAFDHDASNFEAALAWCVDNARSRASARSLVGNLTVSGEIFYSIRYRPPQLVTLYAAALAVVRSANDSRNEVLLLGALGRERLNTGEAEEAQRLFEQQLGLATTLGHGTHVARSLLNLSHFAAFVSDFRESIRLARIALKTSREVKAVGAEGEALSVLSTAYRHLGKLRRSWVLGQAAAKVFRELGDFRNEAVAVSNTAALSVDWRIGGDEQKRSVALLTAHMEIADTFGDERALAISRAARANAYFNMGEYELARTEHVEALNTFAAYGDRANEARTLGDIGRCYAKLGDDYSALESYTSKLAIARPLGDPFLVGSGLYNASLALERLGRKDEALQALDEAIAFFEHAALPGFLSMAERKREEWMRGG